MFARKVVDLTFGEVMSCLTALRLNPMLFRRTLRLWPIILGINSWRLLHHRRPTKENSFWKKPMPGTQNQIEKNGLPFQDLEFVAFWVFCFCCCCCCCCCYRCQWARQWTQLKWVWSFLHALTIRAAVAACTPRTFFNTCSTQKSSGMGTCYR